MIKSLNEFDSTKIRSVVQGQLNLSENEKCVFALYLRVAGNISSVIKLSDGKAFQAVIALSRMILELAVDVKLIADGSIENGVEKALGFHDIQRLRAAHRARLGEGLPGFRRLTPKKVGPRQQDTSGCET